MKISRGRPTLLSAPVPFVFHPMGAASCQPQGFWYLLGARCIRTGSTFTVYWCSQTRLKAYRCLPARLQVQTCRCPQARLHVHRCPQTWLRACKRPQARLQVQPCRYPQARTGQAPGVQVPAGSAPDCPYGLRIRVYVPPTTDTTQPMGSEHPSKASHSQCRPGPKSRVSSG